jgi:hypothetical protein
LRLARSGKRADRLDRDVVVLRAEEALDEAHRFRRIEIDERGETFSDDFRVAVAGKRFEA